MIIPNKFNKKKIHNNRNDNGNGNLMATASAADPKFSGGVGGGGKGGASGAGGHALEPFKVSHLIESREAKGQRPVKLWGHEPVGTGPGDH